MSDFIKTADIPHDELLAIYERISKDYQKEAQENVRLKRDNAFRAEIERLEKLIRSLKK